MHPLPAFSLHTPEHELRTWAEVSNTKEKRKGGNVAAGQEDPLGKSTAFLARTHSSLRVGSCFRALAGAVNQGVKQVRSEQATQ